MPVLTDVHDEDEIDAGRRGGRRAADAGLPVPPDRLHPRRARSSGKPVNIKKGQFLAPHDMKNVIDKARAAAREAGLPEDSFMACERGASFGYNNLVSDMRSLAIMRETGCPVVFDATHSVQLPGGQGTSVGRPARVRAGAGARRGRGRRRRRLHGNASRSGQGASPTARTPCRCKHMKALLEHAGRARPRRQDAASSSRNDFAVGGCAT